MDGRIKLDPLVNQRVRFKLHEIDDIKEGMIRALDERGYWIEGGSLSEYLRMTSQAEDPTSEVQFLRYERIHWVQRA